MRRTFWLWLKLRCGVKEGQRLPRPLLWVRAMLFPFTAIGRRIGTHYIPGATYDPWTDAVTFHNGKTKAAWSLELLKCDHAAQGIYSFTRVDLGDGNVSWKIERVYSLPPDKLFSAVPGKEG